MFAPVVLLIGIYKVMQVLGLTNSLLGLIFMNAAFNQAFTIWLLRGTFLSISAEMEQAATIDGCNRMQAMFKVLLPVAAPGIVTTLIFIFINAWNEYTVALCLISTETTKPLTVGIKCRGVSVRCFSCRNRGAVPESACRTAFPRFPGSPMSARTGTRRGSAPRRNTG